MGSMGVPRARRVDFPHDGPMAGARQRAPRFARAMRLAGAAGLGARGGACERFRLAERLVLDALARRRLRHLDALGVVRRVVGVACLVAAVRGSCDMVPKSIMARLAGGDVPGSPITDLATLLI